MILWKIHRKSHFKNLTHDGSPVSSAKAPSATPITPVKAAELKTIYIAQIKDLHSLLELGAISSNDFDKQILDLMDKL